MTLKKKELSLFRGLKSREEKMTFLREMFLGKKCVILTAGPSIRTIDKDKLRAYLEDKLVIANKQTIKLCPDLVDIHVLNDCNYENYEYEEKNFNPIKILVKSASIFNFVPFLNPDLTFKILRKNSKKNKSLCFLRDYSNWEISKFSTERPWGPGIMHEICIHLPIFFESKEVTFIGWDIGEKDKNVIKRFYEKETILNKVRRNLSERNIFFYNKIFVKVENLIRLILFLAGFKVLINIPGLTKEESNFISESTPDLYKYFRDKNIEAFIVSESSLVSNDFPRKLI